LKKALTYFIQKIDNNIHPKRLGNLIVYLKSFLISLTALFVSVLIGVIGFVIIEGMSIIDAFYMTIITVSTVGFGEVQELSPAGRIFVSFIIITNIGVFTYALSNIFRFFVQGDASRVFSDLLVGRKIDKMNNHIIVCGYGRHGSKVLDNLINQNIECVLIETDVESVAEIRKQKQVTVLEGDATDENTLLEAGVERASALITTLGEDSHNVYVVLTARQLNSEMKIVSRANKSSSKSKMILAGANEVLIPENVAGFYMSAIITKPDIINVFSDLTGFEGSNFKMAELFVDEHSTQLIDKTLGEIALEATTGVKVIGLKHSGDQYIVNPTDETVIGTDMSLIIIGNEDHLNRLDSFVQNCKIIV